MNLRDPFVWGAVGLLLAAAAAPVRAQLPPLIPREVLFGNPVKASPQLAPDGARLSYLAPSEKGVLNVWVKTLGKDDDAMVTNDTHRGIRFHGWAESGQHILYIQDVGGDENFHVYSADLATGVVRDLTPFQGIRAQGMMADKNHPHEILVGLNLRDRRLFDMHRINLTTGAVVPDTLNPGDVLGWITDASFRIRGAMAMNPMDGSTTLRVRKTVDDEWRDLVTWPFGENGVGVGFTADGKGIIATTSLGSDTTRLVVLDAAAGQEIKTLATDRRCDVGGIMIHPDTREVQAAAFNYTRNEWRVLDPAVEKDFRALAGLHRGDFSVVSRTRADDHWIVAYSADNGPVAWYSWNRKEQRGELLFVNQPELEKHSLAPMEPVIIKARDGKELVSYLTVPPGVERRNLPLVLNVHGGPWARDTWGFRPEAQWLANRGYAVLQVNFRGSTGFGKEFLNAGNMEWGVGAMQHDLTDAVRWAVAQGIADPKRVCIYGGSYGGYATLAGLAFTPELYACGVDIVGPSNVRTLLAAIPPYWAPMRATFRLRVGDVETDEEFNRRISPYYHAGNIRVPLIIAQGANDPRVVIQESDQMVEAIRAQELPVTYVVYPDEGHGFARPENRLDFYGRVDEFLAEHLGGRAEPWRAIPGAVVELR